MNTTGKVLTRAAAFGFGVFLARQFEQVSDLNRAIKRGQVKMAEDRAAMNAKWQTMIKIMSEPLAPLTLDDIPDPDSPEIRAALEALGVQIRATEEATS